MLKVKDVQIGATYNWKQQTKTVTHIRQGSFITFIVLDNETPGFRFKDREEDVSSWFTNPVEA